MANNYTPSTWAVAVLRKLRLPVTPGGVKSLAGWAQAEGGHWNNQARYNPLNTTEPEPGAGNTGAQGNIKVYRDWNQGIDATVRTLKNGRYSGILDGLRAGDPAAVANAIAQSPWGTAGGLVRQTIGAASGTVPQVRSTPSGGTSGGTSRTVTTTTPGVDNSQARRALLAGFLGAGGVKSQQATQALASGWMGVQDVPGTTATTTTQVPGAVHVSRAPRAGASPHARPGDPVVSGSQSVGGLHQTDGLPGYPAHDYFAPAGTHAVAPVSGKVVRLSGHDPSQGPVQGPHGPLGWSVYIRGDDGRTYFLTHMGSRNVRVGQKVRQGQVIGTVADYDKYGTPSHIHMGVNG